MTEQEHKAAVEQLKEICRDIGCSGLDPKMCNHSPQDCGIIRKIMFKAPTAARAK